MTEMNHERVAGLFALALASALAGHAGDGGSVAALGDAKASYVVPSDIDGTWAARCSTGRGEARYRSLRAPTRRAPNGGTARAESLDPSNETWIP